jgi:hypothetical protein
MKSSGRVSVLSISALVATILTVSATGVIAQWSDEPARSHLVQTVLLDDADPGKPHSLYCFEFGNNYEGACDQVHDRPNTLDTARNKSDGKGLADAIQKPTITIGKSADPPDGTDFRFRSNLGSFTLDHAVPDDGDAFEHSVTFVVGPLESWTFVELVPAFWELNIIPCAYSGATVDGVWEEGKLVGVRITVETGGWANCTFMNEALPKFVIHLPLVANNYAP